MKLFCPDLISCNCKVMKNVLFGSAKLCHLKVSGAPAVSRRGKNGFRVAGMKPSSDESEAFELTSGLKVHKESKIFIFSRQSA